MLRLPLTLAGGKLESAPVRPTLAGEFASLTLERMSVEQQQIFVRASASDPEAVQVLTVDVSTKPLIGLLWIGTLLLGAGCSVAWVRRTADERAIALAAHASAEIVVRRRAGGVAASPREA